MPTRFNMTDLALLVTGSLNVPDYDNPGQSRRITIQRCPKGFGNVSTLHRYDVQVKDYILGADPKTPAKQANRARFRDAVLTWHDATPAQRAVYKPAAKKRRISLFNAWISGYLADHPTPPITP